LAAQFPQLEILEVIGQGGMGVVYRAKQRKLDRVVALKILTPGAAKDPAFAERFHREARALARLNHPNILTVYDFGEVDGLFYLVMEYVDGADLRHVLQQGRLSPAEALRIVPVVCDALQYAHASGVVHRDIKPGNILLDREGRVKIADFGIAKLAGASAADVTLTQSQQSMGTPHYMAPEQVESPQTVDHRADIYSLGVVFYEMLTGELPLGRFAPPSRRVQVDVRVDEVVLRALEKEPSRRYQQAGDVKTEVERIQNAPTAPAAPAAEGRAGVVPISILGVPRFWMIFGLVWAFLLGLTFYAVERVSRSADAVTPLFWLLAMFGALAPLGTTLCGWVALALADGMRRGVSVLRSALAVLVMLPMLGLGYLGVALGMSLWIEVLGFRPNGVVLFGSVLGTLLLMGWGVYRLGGVWVRQLQRERGARPSWLVWLPAVPAVLGLLATLFTLGLIRERSIRMQMLASNRMRAFIGAEFPTAVVPTPSGSESAPVVGGQTENLPMLGQAPEPRVVTPFSVILPNGQGLQADQPATWEMTAQGPVFTDVVAQRVLRQDAPAKLAALNVALQKAWGEYREVLAANMSRSTNAAGHTVIRLSEIVPDLERISDRFWTAADAVLEPMQQGVLRQIFLPQWRPHWTGIVRGQGVYVATRALLRFGDLPYYFEFWKEGAWYRVRESEGDVSEGSLEQLQDFRVQYLSEAQRLLVEAGEGAASVSR